MALHLRRFAQRLRSLGPAARRACSFGLRSRRTLVARALLLAAVALASGACAGCGSLPLSPTYPTGVATAGKAGLARDQPPDGALRAGDQLTVEVTSGKEKHSVLGIVDARGEVHVAAGRDVGVGGLSLQAAEERVISAVRAGDKFAEVNLQLAARPTQRVSVLGAVLRPGYLELGPGMRVVDVVAATGGLLTSLPAPGSAPTTVADLDDAVLVRDGKALPISIRKALSGTPGHNVLVHPGDQLYVPFATDQLVTVLGQVTAPTLLVHRANLRLTEALSAAGGLTIGADKGDIRLVRGAPDAPKVYQSSLSAIATGDEHDVVLAPGDVLFVEDSWLEDFGEVMEILLPFVGVAVSAVALSLVISR
jgi:polysaccharide export outer membrane protein